jgi:DNA-binding transcriptional LysR family regulator
VQVTDAGARFYEHAKRTIEATEEAEASVASAETVNWAAPAADYTGLQTGPRKKQ